MVSFLTTEEAQYEPRKQHFNNSYFKNLKGIAGAMEFYLERKKNMLPLPEIGAPRPRVIAHDVMLQHPVGVVEVEIVLGPLV